MNNREFRAYKQITFLYTYGVRRNCRAIAIVSLTLAAPMVFPQDVHVETVKPNEGGFYAWGISGDGKVLFGAGSLPNEGSGPMAWSKKDGFTLLTAGQGRVVSSSIDGSALVGLLYGPNNAESAFIWQKSSGLEALTPPSAYQGDNVEPEAISGNGKVVVGSISSPDFSNVSPFVWSEAKGFQVLNFSGRAYSVSDDGTEVVGGTFSQTSYVGSPFIWTVSAGIQLLSYPGSIAFASLVSGDGQNLYISADAGYPDCNYYRWNAANGYTPFSPVWQDLATSANAEGTIFASPFNIWTKYGQLDYVWYMESRNQPVPRTAQFAGVARDGVHFGASEPMISTSYLVTIKHIYPMVRSTFYYLPRGKSLSLQAPYGFTQGSAAGVNPTLEIVRPPSHAEAFSASVDGTLSYTPDPAFSGVDGFKYRLIALDGERSNVGEILFYVQPNLKSISVSRPIIDNEAGEPQDVLTVNFDGPVGTREGLNCFGSDLRGDLTTIPMNFDKAVGELRIPLLHGDPPSPETSLLRVDYRGQSLTTQITIDPPTITDLWVTGLETSSPVGHVRISHNELPEQVTISLTSNSPAAVVPASVKTAAGSAVASFPITLFPVLEPTPVTITATAGNGTFGYKLTLSP